MLSIGIHYNQNSNYTDWRTDSTITSFKQRTECFVNQYHKLHHFANPCNQVWDLIKGKHLFYHNDPNTKGHLKRAAQFAEVMGILRPPPSDLIKRGVRSHEFFAEDTKSLYDFRELSSD